MIQFSDDGTYEYASPWEVKEFAPKEAEITRESVWSSSGDWDSVEKMASANKEWTIAFNQSTEEMESINRFVYVIDADGEEVPVTGS